MRSIKKTRGARNQKKKTHDTVSAFGFSVIESLTLRVKYRIRQEGRARPNRNYREEPLAADNARHPENILEERLRSKYDESVA
jgi:hypothetical protein